MSKDFWQNFKKPITILAPMEDVTDTVFRQIVMECGRPDILFTEFTSTDGLMSKGRDRVIRRLEFEENEKPLIAQIWGNNPKNYYESAKLLVQMGFTGIDINMGCPVRKVVKHGFCSGLIENKSLAKEIVLATIEGADDLPVSVKTRMGFRKIETEEWSEFLLKLGIQALTMHGRLAKDMSKYPANWEEIGKVVTIRDRIFGDDPNRPVIIGNGDVESLEEIDKKIETYKVDGVMVGRGIFKDPFIFNPDISLNDLSISERCELLLRHSEKFVAKWSNERNFAVLKKFYKIYISDFEGASELRSDLMECNNLQEVKNIISKYL